jgi:hypothetical protein
MFYFMHLNVKPQHEISLTRAQEQTLLSICEDNRRGRVRRSKIVVLRVCLPAETGPARGRDNIATPSDHIDSGFEDRPQDNLRNAACDSRSSENTLRLPTGIRH